MVVVFLNMEKMPRGLLNVENVGSQSYHCWKVFDEHISLVPLGFVSNLMDDLFGCIRNFSHERLPVAILVSLCLFLSAH